jgi:hypothetical protein
MGIFGQLEVTEHVFANTKISKMVPILLELMEDGAQRFKVGARHTLPEIKKK